MFLVLAAGFPLGYAAAAPVYTPNIYAGANPGFPNGEKKVTMKSAGVYLIDLETHLPDALQKSQIVPADFLI